MQPNNQTAGAAPELAKIEVENLNRSSFLVRGMLAAGALYGTAAVSPMVRKAFGQASMGDIDILNYALTLEYLEAAFYEGAAKTPGLSKEVAGYVKTFGAEEQEHVDALTATIKDLGGTPVKAPKADFGDAFTSAEKLIPLAITFEDVGVSAYNGAAPEIESKDAARDRGRDRPGRGAARGDDPLRRRRGPLAGGVRSDDDPGRSPQGRAAVRRVLK